MTETTTIRVLTDEDWDDVVALESGAYAALGLSEGRAALRSKAAASPTTCFVLRADARVVGYLLALPYPANRAPALDRTETSRYTSRNLHLHDVAVAPAYRGRGLGRRLVAHLEDTAAAHGCTEVSLIAVAGAETYWSARGYTAAPHVPTAGYDHTAVYMSRSLPSRSPRSRADTPADHRRS